MQTRIVFRLFPALALLTVAVGCPEDLPSSPPIGDVVNDQAGGDPAKCGNGKLDPGEECDGETGCTERCTASECGDKIFDPGTGEQCDDGNSTNDDGCSSECALEESTCGDGIVSAGEACDDTELGGSTCQSEGFGGGDIGCLANCNLDTSSCLAAVCGDDVIGGSEDCDGAELGGFTCEVAGFSGGTLGCTVGCEFDTSQCTGDGPTCGNGVAEQGEECDGTDLRTLSCDGLKLGTGDLGCKTDCTFDASGCSQAGTVCGNGKAEGTEYCDGEDLRNTDCTDAGFDKGTLVCLPSCKFNFAGCMNDSKVAAPSGLSYAFPEATYRANVPITKNVATVDSGDPVADWSVKPDLPFGLKLNPGDGSISGTPKFTSTGTYKVTAKNAGGDDTVDLTITVLPDPCNVVTCDDPDDDTCSGDDLTDYPDTGTCYAGVCTYTPTTVDCATTPMPSCSDNKLRTYNVGRCQTDECVEGTVATTTDCDEIPEPRCENNQRVTTNGIGTCNATTATCDYTETTEACDDPPDAFCDGETAVTYMPSGTCANGDDECVYAEASRTDCTATGETCEAGACVPCNLNKFLCAAGFGACIDNTLICDEANDCMSGMPDDEFDGLCNTNECDKDEFYCDDKCVANTKWCDGTVDCVDYFDEALCCTAPDVWCAADKVCLGEAPQCNGTENCSSGFDESAFLCGGCQPGEFACGNGFGRCIPAAQLCDGMDQCGSGYKDDENEAFCGLGVCAATGEFRCDNTCYSTSKYCDGTAECINFEDEPLWCGGGGPGGGLCNLNEFLCGDGSCVANTKVCDESNDCPFGGDEGICIDCPSNQFVCDFDQCQANTKYCDGNIDCMDGTDEFGCIGE